MDLSRLLPILLAWPDASFRFPGLIQVNECRRVLKSGGLVAVMEQPYGVQSEVTIRRRGDELVTQLATDGFRVASFTFANLQRGPAVFVRGVK
jgi:hypothetical protein